jgi:hypothetical protein
MSNNYTQNKGESDMNTNAIAIEDATACVIEADVVGSKIGGDSEVVGVKTLSHITSHPILSWNEHATKFSIID